jgi:LPS-assembly protein
MRSLCTLLVFITFLSSDTYAAPASNFVSAKFIRYDEKERYVEAIGNVVIMSNNYVITADNVLYYTDKDELWAKGNVRILDGTSKVVVCSSAFFKDKFKQGIMREFTMYFGENSLLAADKAKRFDENHAELTKVRYSPCAICGNSAPIWQISAQKTEMDLIREKVVYRNAFFEVYGIPVGFIPYFSHPTPGAQAQSGLLVPSIKNGRAQLPLYYRLKPNLDFTFTPRFSRDNILYETETRYLAANGIYGLNTSMANSRLTTKNKDGSITKNTKLPRYYIDTFGDIVDSNQSYGFALKHVSDKAFLKNYYNIHQSYLSSKVYAVKVDNSNFISVNNLYFQGLKADDRAANNAIVLPELKVKQVFPVSDNGNTYLTLENNTLGYGDGGIKRIARSSTSLSLTHLYKTDNGHLFKLQGYNRGDLYHVDMSSNELIHSPRVMTRYIPELHLGWRYPLIKYSSDNRSTFLEPQSLLVIGSGNYLKNLKYAAVDTGYYSLSEENIFKANRYSGIDFHEYGTRLSYGLDSTTDISNDYKLNSFLGHLRYLDHTKSRGGKVNVVGRISVNYQDSIDVYYRFKAKGKNFTAYNDEIGFSMSHKKLQGNVGFAHMPYTKYYEYTSRQNVIRSKVHQGYIVVNYNLNDAWSLGSDTRFDIISKSKAALLYRNIKVVYTGDCASIELRFGNDYTHDARRNVQKTHNYWFMIGLKTLNM